MRKGYLFSMMCLGMAAVPACSLTHNTNTTVVQPVVVVEEPVEVEVPVVVDALCTASNDPKLNEAALDVMESLQIKVINR